MKESAIAFIVSMLLLTACSKDNDETVTVETPTGVATVTYLVTPNGLGDNSYNDAAAEGIFAFAHVTGTRLRMLQPKDEAEAGTMYRQWLTDNATKDSAVLIIGSSAYEAIARQTSAAEQDRLQSLKERGGRVLLFESDADIEGISTVIISRYGVSYLAGAMSQNFNALVMSAVKDNPLLDEAISGFLAGYDAHHAEGTAAEVFYLSDGVAGFAMPDSAYHFMASKIAQKFVFRDMVFPLLGGSGIGVLRAMNDEEANLGLVIGSDVDQSVLCSRVPFSMIIQIGEVLHRYLDDWKAGREWPSHQRLGMNEGGADLMLHPSFYTNNPALDDRYRDPETFQRLYDMYKEEAMKKEEAYEK